MESWSSILILRPIPLQFLVTNSKAKSCVLHAQRYGFNCCQKCEVWPIIAALGGDWRGLDGTLIILSCTWAAGTLLEVEHPEEAIAAYRVEWLKKTRAGVCGARASARREQVCIVNGLGVPARIVWS